MSYIYMHCVMSSYQKVQVPDTSIHMKVQVYPIQAYYNIPVHV